MTIAAEVNAKRVEVNNYLSNPLRQSQFKSLEKALNDLILKELNSQDSIFIKISPHIVSKIAFFLSGAAKRPASIGVCGETASGKSTIVLDSISIIESFCQEFLTKHRTVTRINTDDYYYDRSEEVQKAGSFAAFVKNYDLDVPEAIELSLMKKHVQTLLNGNDVILPKYDMSGTAKRIKHNEITKPSSIIMAEGIYTLIEGIEDVFDFKIYVDIEKSVQKERFFQRAQQRGLGDSAEKIFENATQKAMIYVNPCKKNADIIFNGKTSRERYKKFINSVVELLEAHYYNFAV